MTWTRALSLRRLLHAVVVGAFIAATASVVVGSADGTAVASLTQDRTETSSRCVSRNSPTCDLTPTPAPTGPPLDDGPFDVRLGVGDDFQAAVDHAAPGTRFLIAAGVHRMQRVVPKSGHVFVGEPGAVMAGSKVLVPAASRVEGRLSYWSAQTQEATTNGNWGCTPWWSGNLHRAECGHEQEVHHGEELFVDGVRYRHVNTLAAVDQPGEWFFDYAADRIWAYGTFAGQLVETSVTDFAFIGAGVENVTIENLVIRHYANPPQRGALNGHDSRRWKVRFVDASYNHGGGIGIGPGMYVSHSRATYNGQIGMSGTGAGNGWSDPVVVENSEIAFNRTLGFQVSWEAGGTKFVKTVGMVFQNNWVHDNYEGPGLWFDIDNRGATIRSNRVERNGIIGIFWEVSFDADIYWNETWDNQRAGDASKGSGNILVVASSGVEVYENLVGGRGVHEIAGLHQARGSNVLRDLYVHHNVVVVTDAWGGGQVGVKDQTGGGEDLWSASFNNRFSNNSYTIASSASSHPFYWEGSVLTAAQWLEHHPTDKILSGEAQLPPHVVRFSPSHYGPKAQ